MKNTILIAIVLLLSAVSFGSPDLSGQYWFGSLSIDVDTNSPLAKRGTVTIVGNQWDQHWEDYNGKQEFSSAFTKTGEADGSINVNFEQETFAGETYNVAFNGDVMIHAGSVLQGGGEGIDIFTRKATTVDVNDIVGNYRMYGHFLGRYSGDSCVWGDTTLDPNGTFIATWENNQGVDESDIGDWIPDEVNALIDVFGPTLNPDDHAELYLGKRGIISACHVLFDEGRDKNDIGYNVFIKKTDQTITMADITGNYQVRFLQTGLDGIPHTCTQGTCLIEAVDDANGTLSTDSRYFNLEPDMSNVECSIGPGNEFHLNNETIPDGIVSPDRNLIFIPSYRNENLASRTPDDWIGGIFLIRMPAADDNSADLNGDGIVDSADMCILIENWGTDNQLCDIAPPPFGDGVVDIQDLIVLAEHLFEVYPSAETVDVNEADDGEQIELELGELLVVTLESNPSTGYRWEILENNESILKQFGQTEFKSSDTGDPPLVGAGGWEIFRFKAVSAGQMTLELAYRRPWEDAEPLKTFTIRVVVP